MNRILLAGAMALTVLAPAVQAQNRTPRPSRPKPQKPVEIPPAVVVLQVDTTPGDSTRTIIQRDFDFGDRIQPLFLDSATLAEIWQPGARRINFAPLAQTRATLVVRARPTSAGLHVELFDVARGVLRQEDYFRVPKLLPANRLTMARDSLSELLGRKAAALAEALAADSATRDSLERAAAKTVPMKTTRDRANARRAQTARDSISRELDRHATADELLRASAERLPNLSLPTVYATLELFEELGLVRRVAVEAGPALWDPRVDPHQHFACRSCGRVIDLDVPARAGTAIAVARAAGHAPDSAQVVVVGLCRDCAGGPADV